MLASQVETVIISKYMFIKLILHSEMFHRIRLVNQSTHGFSLCFLTQFLCLIDIELLRLFISLVKFGNVDL